jgi:hypothetical protein
MLIKCKECDFTVSDQAKSCPSCGCPIKGEKIVKQNQGCFMKTLNVGCLVVVILLVMAGIAFAQIYFKKH